MPRQRRDHNELAPGEESRAGARVDGVFVQNVAAAGLIAVANRDAPDPMAGKQARTR
jgi:hypothetical protein